MVDEKEIRQWIERLEADESSWKNYERLAALYTIMNQQGGKNEMALSVMYSAAPAKVSGDSEFLQAVSSADQSKAWAVMDELMDSMKVVNERIYNNVMRKLNG